MNISEVLCIWESVFRNFKHRAKPDKYGECISPEAIEQMQVDFVKALLKSNDEKWKTRIKEIMATTSITHYSGNTAKQAEWFNSIRDKYFKKYNIE